MTYHAAHGIDDNRWKRRCFEIFEKANWRCQYCCRADKKLHVHHVHYIKGRMLWEYDDNYLMALCYECHQEKHEAEKSLTAALRMALKHIPGRRMQSTAAKLMGIAMEELSYE